MTLLLAEEHSQPLVSVVMWYRVGARNERPGISGIAHYLEHMAFRATENIPAEDVTGVIERLGGHWHGYTRLDNTAYYETARREAMDWLLFLEAERMQRLRLIPAEVKVERGGILSELKGYENDPWSLLFDEVAAAAFREHPYGYNISGWVSDVEAITHADVVEFYRRTYVPANAILVLVGDFEPARALAAARRHLGGLPKRPALEPLRTVEPLQRGEKRVTLRMPGAATHVLVAHHAPAFQEPDFFPFLVLDALLSGGRGVDTLGAGLEIGAGDADRRSSRLYRELVATGLATRVSSGLLPTLHPYLYTVTAEAAPGVSAQALEGAIVRALERPGEEPPSAEEMDAVRRRLSTLTLLQEDRYQDAAHLRALLEAYGAGDLWGRLPERIAAAGAAEVQAAARRHLHSDNRTVGVFEPRDEARTETARAEAGARAVAERRMAAGAAAAAALRGAAGTRAAGAPISGAARTLGFPAAPVSAEEPREAQERPAARRRAPEIRLARIDPPPPARTRRLPSGLVFAAARNPWVGTAALVVEIDAGPAWDPEGGEGTATLAARLLASGSEERGPAETAAAIDRLGLRWSVEVGGAALQSPDPRRIRIEIEFAAPDLEEVASLLAGSLRAPVFPSDAFRAARQAHRSEIAGLEDDTTGLAWARLLGGLYADAPLGRPTLGTSASVAALGRADVARFHRRHYRPERTRVAFAGGLPAERALDALERAFLSWGAAGGERREETPGATAGEPGGTASGPHGGVTESASAAEPPPPAAPRAPQPVRLMHKTQADLAYGFFTGVASSSPERLALEALAHVLHHNYAGRLGERIIMREGLAYSIDSRLEPELPGSPWVLGTGAPPGKIETLRRLWESILDEVAAHGITARELEGARTYLQGRLLHERESNLSAARAALERLRAGGGGGQAEPASLTLEQVNRLARRVLKDRRAIWSLVGPLP